MGRPRKVQTQLNSLGQLVPITVSEVKPVTYESSGESALPIIFNDPKLLNLFFINGVLNEDEVRTFIKDERYLKLKKLIGKREIKQLLKGESEIIPQDMKRKQRKLLGRLYLYANYQALYFKKKFKKKGKRRPWRTIWG